MSNEGLTVKELELIRQENKEERLRIKKAKAIRIKKEVEDQIKVLKEDEDQRAEEIATHEKFMEMLSNESIVKSFTRKKPNLPEINVDANGREISYEKNVMRKGKNVKMTLSKEHVEELNYCFQHPIYTIRNYVKIVNEDLGLIDFKLYQYQAEFIQNCFGNKRVIASFPRQSGKTTTSASFMLMFAVYNKRKTIAIVANKKATSKEILFRIGLMYDYLPMWMKPGIEEWNKESIIFSNGCRIIAAATSSDSIRGQSISLLYLDEFAFIQKNMVNQFIESTFPVISSSKLARIIITSTPNGKNHFYKFFMDAKHHKSAFVSMGIKWNEVPGRNEKWKKEMISELGSIEKFNQEYGAEFIEASNLAFSADTLRHIDRVQTTESLLANVKVVDGLKIYERPIKGQKYLIIAVKVEIHQRC